MAQHKQGVREMRLVFETEPRNFSRSDIHMMDRITNALAQVQNVNISVAFFDENGRRLRKTDFGEATPEMKKLIVTELGVEGEVISA